MKHLMIAATAGVFALAASAPAEAGCSYNTAQTKPQQTVATVLPADEQNSKVILPPKPKADASKG